MGVCTHDWISPQVDLQLGMMLGGKAWWEAVGGCGDISPLPFILLPAMPWAVSPPPCPLLCHPALEPANNGLKFLQIVS